MSDQYDKLRELLVELDYPSLYMYKFIVKQDPSKVIDIQRCFSETAEFQTKDSKNGNYISVTIREMMLDAESIINRYKDVSRIENVITL